MFNNLKNVEDNAIDSGYFWLWGIIFMNQQVHLDLPIELEEFRSSIENSLLPLNKIHPFSKRTALMDSKFSGIAYLPQQHTYPKDINGRQMFLLAQINFSQEKLVYPFPKEGILQFFISPTIFNTNQTVEEHLFQHYFKVRYFPEVLPLEHLQIETSCIELPLIESFPIGEEMALVFSSGVEPISAMDYRIEDYLRKPLSHYRSTSSDEKSIEDIYFEHFLGAEHKIGGYPYFIYPDTRKNSPFLRRFDTLLLQIISNDEENIMWGDSGIIKFFINKQKLLNLDFSDIYFIAEQYE